MSGDQVPSYISIVHSRLALVVPQSGQLFQDLADRTPSRVSAEPSPADEQQQQISADSAGRLHREFKVHLIVIVNKISNELHHRTRRHCYI
ncbi:hypothetical protein V1478_017811 [Vespula squamosa]|uniref:Uncharacterized protein n=1 Tax=Vespula squamosa TaxID=30214 RepID=A0ABD1ZV99_VESSQ